MTAAQPSAMPEGMVLPLSLEVDELAAMLNFELAEHPVYDGGELQWFDDDVHGTGMLAFLSRRADGRVDYYQQHGLRLDPERYAIGGGTGGWHEIDFDVARLAVREDGVDAEARFTDVDGRLIEIRVDDRDGRPRRPAGLLAPVSAAIEQPTSLLLVWMPRFDLVRRTGEPPVVRIDGVDASTGRLPGARLHRRHLVKQAAPVVTIVVNRDRDGAATGTTRGQQVLLDAAGGVAELRAEQAGHHARLRFAPALPDLAALPDGTDASGRWHVAIDATRLTGGTWSTQRRGDAVTVAMDVDERWRPRRLPWLMRLVTTVVPVFRRWPTTYRWRGEVRLDAEGAGASLSSSWERTGDERGRAYRSVTGS